LYRWVLQARRRQGFSRRLVLSENHIRTYWWCSPDRIGSRTAGSPDLGATHRPAATLSNVKGKRDAPSLPANVTCLHNTQTNRGEPRGPTITGAHGYLADDGEQRH
jgi:hypothetical protein